MTQPYRPLKYMITTFGCQANVADSNTLAGILEALDFEETKRLEESDLYIINTCSVRQKSEDKAYGVGRTIKQLRDQGSKVPLIVMAGCMVGSVTGDRQRYQLEELKKKTPWVNEYINPDQLQELPSLLVKNGLLSEWAIQKINWSEILPTDSDLERDSALVNISTGCDNFCTFCVVPYSRGHEISRSKEEILREVHHYLSRGYSKITLCGQNVNSWGLDMAEKFDIRSGSDQKLPFANLLRELHDLPQLSKIDFISSNPFDFTTDLIEIFKLPKISNYLHMAVQSGSNKILEKMNRRHTVEDFKELVQKIREHKPDLQLGTDIIVGFPSESAEDFLQTVELFKQVRFDNAYISIYSARKGTPAAKLLVDDVPLSEKKRRHEVLTKVWKETRRSK